jgi:hypothetical protein
MSRYILHQLIDRIPEEELSAAQRFLEYLAVSPAHRRTCLRRRMTNLSPRATRPESHWREKKFVQEKLSRMTMSCGIRPQPF